MDKNIYKEEMTKISLEIKKNQEEKDRLWREGVDLDLMMRRLKYDMEKSGITKKGIKELSDQIFKEIYPIDVEN